jgi:hypothetical protein
LFLKGLRGPQSHHGRVQESSPYTSSCLHSRGIEPGALLNLNLGRFFISEDSVWKFLSIEKSNSSTEVLEKLPHSFLKNWLKVINHKTDHFFIQEIIFETIEQK